MDFKAVYFLRGSRSALPRAGAAIALCVVAAGLASSAPVKLPPEAVLYSFRGGSDGRNPPVAGLITDTSGALYGTTQLGGTFSNPNCRYGCGAVFKLTPPNVGQTQWSYKVLYRFTGGSDGAVPQAGLILDSSGALYGTTEGGGDSNQGTVFKLTPPLGGGTPWIETVLHSFAGGSGGANPLAGLIFGSQGALYGTTVRGGTSAQGTVFKLVPPPSPGTPWTETVLYSFCSLSSCRDGAAPAASLIFDAKGALYGTTDSGGPSTSGTVFKLAPPPGGGTPWTETVLHSFCSLPSCSDGAHPVVGVIFDSSGTLYGAASDGGTPGYGTVFKLTPPNVGQTQWRYNVLYSFTNGRDGGSPRGELIFDSSGTLYGTASSGGTLKDGTVFKLTPAHYGRTPWIETTLYSFHGYPSDGAFPSGLIRAFKGALYGLTTFGGASSNCPGPPAGCGTVFRLQIPGF
jgi:uncharacterized repeat protein (TIGR03803 family)